MGFLLKSILLIYFTIYLLAKLKLLLKLISTIFTKRGFMLKQNLLISRTQVWEKIDLIRTKGNTSEIEFSFVKKDLSVRRMIARIGVKAGVTGEGLHWDPRARDMLTVHEVKNPSLIGAAAKDKKRIVNISSLLNIKIEGETYQVVDHLSDEQIKSVNNSIREAKRVKMEQKRFKDLQKMQKNGLKLEETEVA